MTPNHIKKFIIIMAALLPLFSIKAQTMPNDKSTDSEVLLRTSEGDILVRLYDDTPAHRDNFLKLASEGFYDGVLFHRVINQFMVQAGDPNSKNPDNKLPLGAGDPNYTLPAEIHYPQHFHKYGALAAARTGDQVNPERRSSGSQFYIVTGRPYAPEQMQQLQESLKNKAYQAYFQNLVEENWPRITELRNAGDEAALNALSEELKNRTLAECHPEEMPAEIVETYTRIGGTPHLDGDYTVFGEVVSGMDVVERIQKAATDGSDRPVQDIRIIEARPVSPTQIK